eukprot:CAMPEP_0170628872 /NCGR_PEP_ID=MMETSP0224-20130122/32973_1 /TAXON_ID=285029 /ORGANISM="Togula jolla, Strain CCCM 725" /LENGTH=94 /DNA_ID=CAMNT_0010956441 /DNA_START=20 /DNA_END=301 /DNA_ORIENTATION=+
MAAMEGTGSQAILELLKTKTTRLVTKLDMTEEVPQETFQHEINGSRLALAESRVKQNEDKMQELLRRLGQLEGGHPARAGDGASQGQGQGQGQG